MDRNEFITVPNEPHKELPNELIKQEASALIASYKEAFKKTPAFLKALGEHFFGKLSHGKLVNPEMRDTVSFLHKNVPWEVRFSFTENDQAMAIGVSSPVDLPYQEVQLTLKSSRKDLQQVASPLIQVIGTSDSLEKPVIHRNTQNAIDIAKLLLDFYRNFPLK